MFKAVFGSALLASASAQAIQNVTTQGDANAANNQDLENLVDQANIALSPLLQEQDAAVMIGDTAYLNINNYEWIITEFGNEFEFSVNELSMNANNLEPTLAALLTNSGNYLQNNAQSLAGLLDAEAASLGVVIEGQDVLAKATNQYGAMLKEEADNIAAQAAENYQESARAFATNQNGITTSVNQQINDNIQNQEALTTAVGNAITSALVSGDLNNLNLNNLPIQTNGDLFAVANAALGNNIAQYAQSAQNSLGSLQSLASQGLSAGSNAALDNNLPSSLVKNVNSASNYIAGNANDLANNAASTLNSNVNALTGAAGNQL